MTYVDPRPEGELIDAYYASFYYGSRHPALKNAFMDLRARKIGRPTGIGRVLDIGCGGGDFLLACRRRGWSVFGVEQKQAPVMQKLDNLGIDVVSPSEMNTLPGGSFECVTAWHVLEHIPEPRATLEEVRRLLTPDGRVVIEVPNFGGWQANLGGADWFHVDVPRHLLHFERSPLERLLDVSGFTAESWHTFSLEYDTFSLTQTFLNKICRHPNHLFQILIGNPTHRDLRDTILSFGLLVPVGVVAVLISLLAPLTHRGGVLRVVARPKKK